MKWMIASDIHGSAHFCEKLMEAYGRERAERLILLGDLLYHGPRNPLPEGYDPMAVARMLNPLKRELLCVRGNCDAEVDQMVLEFPIMADYAVIPAAGFELFVTHGHLFEQKEPPVKPGGVLLMGHTHVQTNEKRGDRIICNPGSISLPKPGSYRGYMLLEDGALIWKTLEGREMDRLVPEKDGIPGGNSG